MKENILNTLCLNCMKNVGEEFETCPFCGAAANVENQFHQLAPKSILNGRFVIGKTLGQGGFGITYAGYDLTADTKVAIKEFYPDGGVSRQKDMYTILPYSEKKTEELFYDGKAKFLKEAQKLVKFTGVDGIVQVKDYFEENGTAYIVMEYVEGPTLIQYLNKLGQPILPSDLYILLTPVFNALEQVHAQGILHRDISPDNIIVSPSMAKLLDFGAARDFSLLGEKSNTINIKAGYAPDEQYLTHGKQGPWTDIYALSATCYRAVTGKTPSSSMDRLSSDDLVPPSALNAHVTPAIEQVLMKGMAVKKENRYQSVKEFREALNRAVNEMPETFSPQAAEPAPVKKKNKKHIMPVCIAAAATVIIAVLLIIFIPHGSAPTSRPNSSSKPAEKHNSSTTTKAAEKYNSSTATTAPEPVKEIKINGKKYSTDLTFLDLSGQGLYDWDIQDLKYMTKLQRIELSDNNLSDISVLQNIPSLVEIDADNNQISNISFFRELKNLEIVVMNGNMINDISVFSHFSTIRKIWMCDNAITDISPVAGNKGLTEAGFNNCRIGDISALRGMSDLGLLCLYNCAIDDISVLSDCTALYELYLGENCIIDFSPLVELENLSIVSLDNNYTEMSWETAESLNGIKFSTVLYLRGMNLENNADAAEMILSNIRWGSDDAYVAFL